MKKFVSIVPAANISNETVNFPWRRELLPQLTFLTLSEYTRTSLCINYLLVMQVVGVGITRPHLHHNVMIEHFSTVLLSFSPQTRYRVIPEGFGVLWVGWLRRRHPNVLLLIFIATGSADVVMTGRLLLLLLSLLAGGGAGVARFRPHGSRFFVVAVVVLLF